LEQPEEKKDYVPKADKTNTHDKNVSFAALYICDIKTKPMGNMKCPFHPMHGVGNLSILDSGLIYCFHKCKRWWPDQFISEYKQISLWEAKLIVELIKILYEETKE
ncbi:unnamed protein product, partial [marine sediment metagenome]